ncbi:MAG TPA: MarR family transcriptional regulator [Chondromyces sp.]|nr:MarR family transcriptional regulator [Chondromyces sp.]
MATRHQGPAAEKRALDAYIKLRRAVNAVSLRENEVMRAAGLTESQFGALEALHHLGPLCQHELAGKVLKSAGNMTTVVDNLERRGLVERRRDREDRRVVTIHLTDHGGELVREVFPRVVEVLVDAFSALSAGEQQQLAALCRRLGASRS